MGIKNINNFMLIFKMETFLSDEMPLEEVKL
jgi:hypothetical protein